MNLLPTILAYASSLLGAVTVLVGLWRKVIVPVARIVRRRVEARDRVLEDIAKEFRPNGGGSIRDVLNRIDARSASTAGQVRAMISCLDIMIVEMGPDGGCRSVSERWLTMAGMQTEAALGEGWITSVHEEDRDRVLAAWLSAVQGRREFNSTYRMGCDEEGYLWVRNRTTPNLSPLRELLGYAGTVEILKDQNHYQSSSKMKAARSVPPGSRSIPPLPPPPAIPSIPLDTPTRD